MSGNQALPSEALVVFMTQMQLLTVGDRVVIRRPPLERGKSSLPEVSIRIGSSDNTYMPPAWIQDRTWDGGRTQTRQLADLMQLVNLHLPDGRQLRFTQAHSSLSEHELHELTRWLTTGTDVPVVYQDTFAEWTTLTLEVIEVPVSP